MTAFNFCHCGNVLDVLPRLVADGIKTQCVVTSPPYWGLRDYGVEGQLGLEKTPPEYVARMVEVFGYVYQILRDDGVMWLNLGDSYSSYIDKRKGYDPVGYKQASNPASIGVPPRSAEGLPHKNLVGIPWRVAFALQENGWILRSEVIWVKPNPMPESVKDRPTNSHEHVFLFSKSQNYFYDHQSVREPAEGLKSSSLGKYSFKRPASVRGKALMPGANNGSHRPDRDDIPYCSETRSLRNVWIIPVQACKGAHFAVFPESLAENCIKSGSRPGDVVFDPFMGSGTVAVVSENLGRRWLGVELNPEYIAIQDRRLAEVNPLLKAVNL